MHILVTNDDGYRAPGLQYLAEALAPLGEVTVVAPERNRSGASNALTLDRPLCAHRADNGFIFLDGTPTDCVHLAITGLLDREPDMVVSGINAGANLGDDILYSGTVAAAMEGRFLGHPALAISITSHAPEHFPTAARLVRALVMRLVEDPLPPDTILNVNVPDLPWERLAGIEVTRLGNRHRAEPVVRDHDPRGRPIYWIGPAGPEEDAGPGTDFHAIATGRASITPIHVDLTHHQTLPALRRWVEGVRA